MASLRALLFPASRRQLRHSRWLNIGARTVHLAATGILMGGHVFGAETSVLMPLLWVAIVSGGVMIALEVYPTADWVHQMCALAVYVKLGVLCLIPFLWDHRVPLLLAVVVLAGVGSHAPRRVRHYSFWYRRVMAD